MALSPGTRLGPYEVIAPLGAGGMGEVYRARDSQLKREVALKTLPEGVAASEERLARFQREAEVLAALNHPNIAQIHGLAEGQSGSKTVRALVMELVAGDDLAARIAADGALPVSEALAIARQIAVALDFAHERGIVHRDLKPANVKVTPEGVVKVLDFGLAKAVSPDAASDVGAANSPTLTSPVMTGRGVILGTAAYMSPEQAAGKAVDKRCDIWAFGCVLFELLSGARAFDGADATDYIVAVISREPSWQRLPAATPPLIRRLLRRCLEKDRKRRLADIRDALFEIDDAVTHPGGNDFPQRNATVQRAGWALAGAAATILVGAAVVALGGWPAAPPPPRPLDLSFFHTEGREVGAPHISPDGRKVAYRARRADGMPMIWIRDLETGDARTVAGTEEGSAPFWSPDSRHIAFFIYRSLKRVPVDGGPAQLLLASGGQTFPLGGSWAGDVILYAPSDEAPLRVVPATGGESRPVTELKGVDWAHFFPSFLPDGRRFLFTAKLWSRSAEASEQGIYVGSLDSMAARRVLPDLSSAVYVSPGYLVFVRNGKLTAVPFDAGTASVTGAPVSLGGPDIAFDPVFYSAGVSAATADGTLAIRPAPANVMGWNGGPAQLQLIDREGHRRNVAQPFGIGSPPAVSRDGRQLAVGIATSDGTIDLGLIDMRTGRRTSITTARAYTGYPVWSPDQRFLAYTFQGPGMVDDIYLRDMATGTSAPLIESADRFEHPIAWSRDGSFLMVDALMGDNRSMQVYSMAAKTLSVFSAANLSFSAAFSPDDRFVAFNSTESGRYEAYVTTFPERRQTWPLTNEGGRALSWSADGREILVATRTGHIVAYPVSTAGGAFSAGQPSMIARDLSNAEFATAPADHSFVVVASDVDGAKDRGEIRLLFGWTSRLQTRP